MCVCVFCAEFDDTRVRNLWEEDGKVDVKAGMLKQMLSCGSMSASDSPSRVLSCIWLVDSYRRQATCTVCSKCLDSRSVRCPTGIWECTPGTGEQPFQCVICKQQFWQSFLLKVHLHSYSGEQPYACEVCKKQFVHSWNLKLHIMYIHTEKDRFPAIT